MKGRRRSRRRIRRGKRRKKGRAERTCGPFVSNAPLYLREQRQQRRGKRADGGWMEGWWRVVTLQGHFSGAACRPASRRLIATLLFSSPDGCVDAACLQHLLDVFQPFSSTSPFILHSYASITVSSPVDFPCRYIPTVRLGWTFVIGWIRDFLDN